MTDYIKEHLRLVTIEVEAKRQRLEKYERGETISERKTKRFIKSREKWIRMAEAWGYTLLEDECTTTKIVMGKDGFKIELD